MNEDEWGCEWSQLLAKRTLFGSWLSQILVFSKFWGLPWKFNNIADEETKLQTFNARNCFLQWMRVQRAANLILLSRGTSQMFENTLNGLLRHRWLSYIPTGDLFIPELS